jgi:Trypsin-like peptidase domain
VLTRPLATLLTLATACVVLCAAPASSAPDARSITPKVFSEVATGVVRITTRNCKNRPLGQGTGFLVGSRVVMTARHVLVGGCSIRATVGGRSYSGSRVLYWYSSKGNVGATDLATFRLDRDATGHVFDFALRTPKLKTTIAMTGFPLGNPLSLHQGRYLGTRTVNAVPTMAVFMVGAQGASGSPFLDPRGEVVGILQRGFVQEDAGVVVGINLARWWGKKQARVDLCEAYARGGIPGCGDEPPPPTCSNALDDDGDSWVDYPDDPGCSSPSDQSELDSAQPPPSPEPPPPPAPPPVETVPVQDAFTSSTDACTDRVVQFPLSARVWLCMYLGAFQNSHPHRVDWISPTGQVVFSYSGTVTPGYAYWAAWLDFPPTAPSGIWSVRFYFDNQLYGQVSFRRG